MKSVTFPLVLPGDLYQEVGRTAEQTRLSKADILRQSIQEGLPGVKQRLSAQGRITNVDPLPDAVARKLYSERDDDMESVRRFIAAQPKDAA